MPRKAEPKSKPVVDIKTKTPGKVTPDQQRELAKSLNDEGARIAKKVSKIGQTPTKGKR